MVGQIYFYAWEAYYEDGNEEEEDAWGLPFGIASLNEFFSFMKPSWTVRLLVILPSCIYFLLEVNQQSLQAS